MQITDTKLKGCFIIEPKVFGDARGYFFESFNAKTFKEVTGLETVFRQDNQAGSVYGVVRGLHLQRGKTAQTKLVRAIQGRILDVAVDVRKGSPTYGQHIAVELTADNQKQLYVPHGFAHGYSVLSDYAVVAYKCDNFYDKSAEDGLYLYDTDLQIDWMIPETEAIISEKDKQQKSLKDFEPVIL